MSAGITGRDEQCVRRRRMKTMPEFQRAALPQRAERQALWDGQETEIASPGSHGTGSGWAAGSLCDPVRRKLSDDWNWPRVQ